MVKGKNDTDLVKRIKKRNKIYENGGHKKDIPHQQGKQISCLGRLKSWGMQKKKGLQNRKAKEL